MSVLSNELREAQAAAPATNHSALTFCVNATILQDDQSDFTRMLSIYFSVLSVLSLVYGISTWIVLPNARSFQNYAYIQVVLVQTLRCWSRAARPHVSSFTAPADYFQHGSSLAFQCWLLVASLCMYEEIVIFFLTLTNFFYSANLFAWGLPAATILLTYIINTAAVVCYENRAILYILVECVLLMVNVLCYVRVVLSVCAEYLVLSPSRTSRRRSLLHATLTLLLAVTPALLHLISLSANNIYVDFILNVGFPSLVIIVWFVCLKSNLEMWFEWFRP